MIETELEPSPETMGYEKETTEQPTRRLDPDFVQGLWYDSENNVISIETIRKKLYEFVKKFGNEAGQSAQTSAQILFEQISKPDLKAIQKTIKKTADPQIKEKLSQRQIEIILAGMEKTANKPDTPERLKRILDYLII